MGSSRRLEAADLPPIYAIADATALGGVDRLSSAVKVMVRAGLRWVQVRAKGADDGELCRQLADCLGEFDDRGPTALWINDRPDLASLFGAAGVHLGQEDLPAAAARSLLGDACWIGRSTHDLEQLAVADADPDVDVVALGPIFATRSKEAPEPTVGLELLAEARQRTAKPLLAIGGIDASRVTSVLTAGADSAVVLGALCVGDVEANCRRFAGLAADLVSG